MKVDYRSKADPKSQYDSYKYRSWSACKARKRPDANLLDRKVSTPKTLL